MSQKSRTDKPRDSWVQPDRIEQGTAKRRCRQSRRKIDVDMPGAQREERQAESGRVDPRRLRQERRFVNKTDANLAECLSRRDKPRDSRDGQAGSRITGGAVGSKKQSGLFSGQAGSIGSVARMAQAKRVQRRIKTEGLQDFETGAAGLANSLGQFTSNEPTIRHEERED